MGDCETPSENGLHEEQDTEQDGSVPRVSGGEGRGKDGRGIRRSKTFNAVFQSTCLIQTSAGMTYMYMYMYNVHVSCYCVVIPCLCVSLCRL